jgi:thiol peroxidase
VIERLNAVAHRGKPLTLIGPELRVGDKAPEFRMHDKGFNDVHLADSAGHVRFFSVIPSLDTSVCAIQTQKFNEQLAKFENKADLFTVSAELPYNQKRYCSDHNITSLQPLSDHYDMSFANAYGLHIKERRYHARAVIIVDKSDRISYIEVLPDIVQEPDYDKAIAALEKTIG